MIDVLLGIAKSIPKERACIGNHLEYSIIKSKIKKSNPSRITIVYGPPGCGKSFMVDNAVNACKKHAIRIAPFKKMSGQFDIPTISINPNNIIVIEDIDSITDMDNIIINKVLENGKVPVVCTCRYIPKKLAKKKEGIDKIHIQYIHKNDISRWLVKNKYPKELINGYSGDLTAFHSRLELWKTTRWLGNQHEYYIHIEDRMKTIHTTTLDEAFKCHIDEPGAMCALIQQNVPQFKNMTIEKNADISDSLSIAETYSEAMYQGLFGASSVYQDLYYAQSIAMIRGCVPPSVIQPGQAWTKHINMIARRNKYKRFKATNGYIITSDHVGVFNRLLSTVKKIPLEMLEGYEIDNKDVDIFTKLFTVAKITPRVKAQLKEALKQGRRE